jgi:hypothetical protein
MCLEGNGWDLAKALANFEELKVSLSLRLLGFGSVLMDHLSIEHNSFYRVCEQVIKEKEQLSIASVDAISLPALTHHSTTPLFTPIHFCSGISSLQIFLWFLCIKLKLLGLSPL